MHNCPNCGIALRKYEDFHFGNVSIDKRSEIVFKGREVPISPQSRMVAEALIRAEGRVLTRSVLLDITGVDGGEDGADIRTIDVYVKRARNAFKEIDPNFDQIIAMRGLGYRWEKRENFFERFEGSASSHSLANHSLNGVNGDSRPIRLADESEIVAKEPLRLVA